MQKDSNILDKQFIQKIPREDSYFLIGRFQKSTFYAFVSVRIRLDDSLLKYMGRLRKGLTVKAAKLSLIIYDSWMKL